MLLNIIKILCWLGYIVFGVILFAYYLGYKKIKKQVEEIKEEENEREER